MTGFAAAAGIALLLVRPGMIVMTTPFLGALDAPPQVRVGLTLLLGLLMAAAVRVPVTLPAVGLTVVVLREVAIGLSLSLAIRVIIAGAEFAGHFTGYQIGLSQGSLIDPQSGVRNNVVALVYGNLVTIMCLASNAHHTLLRALADSYTLLPMGIGGVSDSLSTSVARTLGLVFVLGVRIAAPMMMVLLLVEFALGVLARVAPSLNVMVAGAPVRLIVGLLVVALGLSALPALISYYVPIAFTVAGDTAKAFR
jgi:flagellar biosynthetic protein FliR